ncbi:Histone H3 (Lys9) methyltransferase SUV39H1/Clr4, required for transcriptional silencing [Plasmopara halstedii]|uniref:Histone H3 (Lys9) methyltransferase SUV39H1/Clr4, required for transcriptional silencing n=1 Tax=Plasmopara halstedii TaxID=4781 RepID=A0A0P1A7U6_PLAHL|nr:Histone H3 (Lys9) methyltransferase SUV39H1/Clr4, required for transcriptional silencing [Plasmopara halstedii]CEG36223.1 Histone H3 (Lys9) methyltransferase SUV39H1/Clr4, required for transcriptional silencing [Plasmopara halstedii]|eukprot:XP_024572592.1 Histone H3 (Lys9) methyltransferase SUV39H1/Clr4, required for transcriptional silencing [Plasmopara halstedii]
MAQLLRAAANGDLDKVIALRGSWGFQNKKGESVLHVAVAEDQLEIVQHLVCNGANLNLQEKKHRFTPLMLALAQQPMRFEEIFHALLKGKPDLSIQNSSGQTVLHLAAEYEEVEPLKLLLRAKLNVDLHDDQKMTALHVAVGKQNVDIVQLLVESGRANVNVVDSKGNSALHWACMKNGDDQLELLKFLISKGAKPLKNSHGNTPLHTEAMHCDPSANWPTAAANLLVTAFPDLKDGVNNRGLTAQQIFEHDIDTEDPVEVKSNTQKDCRSKSNDDELYQYNTEAVRAAAIAHSKKKTTKKITKEGSGIALYMWIAVLLAIIAIWYAMYWI